jgi:uncharacterized membrane protein (UPF0127 family)
MNDIIDALNTMFGANITLSNFRCIDKMVFAYQPDRRKKANLKDTPVKISVVYILKKLNPNGLFA